MRKKQMFCGAAAGVRAGLALALLAGSAQLASAQVTISQLLTEEVLIATHPEFTGQIPLPVYIDGDRVVINGFAASGDIAFSHGTLADPAGQLAAHLNNTLNPDTNNPFVSIIYPTLKGARFSFFGISKADPAAANEYGLFYQDTPGGPLLPASPNYNGFIPGAFFANDADHWAFSNSNTVQLFQTGNTPTIAVDTNTPVPGFPGQTFNDVAVRPFGQGGDLTVFDGGFDTFDDGIFTVTPGGPVQTIATTVGNAPGHNWPFDFLGNAVTDGQDIAFNSGIDREDHDTLFARINGTLMEIADADDMLPFGFNGGLDIGGLLQTSDPAIAIENGRIVFLASSFVGSTKGIFSWTADEGITKIVGPGDIVDGSLIGDVEFSSNGLSGNTVAFLASYQDGATFRRAVYTAAFDPALPADLDGDGDIDGVDLGLFFAVFTGPGNGPPANPDADLDKDNDVDGVDLGQAFSLFTGPLSPSNVPEPGSLGLLGLGGILFGRRR